MIVQVVSGTAQVGPLHYFYADEVIGNGDFNENNKQSVPIRGGTSAVVEKGSSLSRLVGLVVSPGDATFAEVVGTDAYGRHPLTTAEVGPNGFPDGLVPAFYSTDPGDPVRFNYVRPQRDADDPNGTPGPDLGLFTSDERGALLVKVHLTGGLIDVDVTATPTDDTRRSFALSSDPSGGGFTFDWHLPGGDTSAEATPTYVVPDNGLPGTYPVAVALDRASDGSFGWGSASIQVGPKASQSPSPSPSQSPGTGGNGPGDQGPTSNPSGSQSAEPNPDPGGGGQPTGVPTLPEPSDVSGSGTSGPTPAPSDGGSTPTDPTQTATAGSGGDEVTGILLTAAEGAAAGGGAVVSDGANPSQAARPLGDPPFRVGTAVWCGVLALLLLLAGAGSESAWLRQRVRDRWSRMSP